MHMIILAKRCWIDSPCERVCCHCGCGAVKSMGSFCQWQGVPIPTYFLLESQGNWQASREVQSSVALTWPESGEHVWHIVSWCQLMSAGFVCIFRPRPCKSFNVSAPIFGITSRRFAIYWSPSRGCQRFLIILEIMPFKQSNILLVAILAILFQGKSNVKVAFGMHLEACQLQLRHVERWTCCFPVIGWGLCTSYMLHFLVT